MPPIPEDAVVIADYMLMSDFVGISASTTSPSAGGLISKGTRFVSPSRDMFYNTPNNSFTFSIGGPSDGYPAEGSYIYSGIGTTSVASLPFFGVNAEVAKYSSRTILLIDSETSETGVTNPSSPQGNWNNHSYKTTNLTAGLHTVHHKPNGNNHWNHGGTWIASPIHSSSHYQIFETPFLKELVGGDRNMEQTNLVVTPDGKTWDEVTRDTSYMGNVVVSATGGATQTGSSGTLILDEFRGDVSGDRHYQLYYKDWTIAYDRWICLKDGFYNIQLNSKSSASNNEGYLRRVRNGSTVYLQNFNYEGDNNANWSASFQFLRGDALFYEGAWQTDGSYSRFEIIRL